MALTIGADAPPGNAHPLASPTAVTFDPNVMGPPVDERDPAIVAAAYLRARLTCDRFDDGPVACALSPASMKGPPEPVFCRRIFSIVATMAVNLWSMTV